MANLKRIASIRANDEVNGKIIYFLVDDNFKVTSTDGEVSYGDTPTNVKEAFEVVNGQWQYWNTLEWIAEYDDETNEIVEN